MYFDYTYFLVMIGAAICMIASANVKSTYNKYASVRSMTGMTGAQVAERLLRAAAVALQISTHQIIVVPGEEA